MTNWAFQTFPGTTSRKPLESIVYQNLMQVALDSKPTPHQSGFEVREAALTESGLIIPGSNHEYGTTRAIHGEESIVANVIERAGQKDFIVALAILTNVPPGTITAPCGNCRDLIKQYCAHYSDLLFGSPKGGKAIIMPMSQIYFDDFSELPESSLEAIAKSKTLSAALNAERKSYSIYAKPEQVYGVGIRSGSMVFGGGLEGDAAYHPSLPIRNALINLIYGSNNSKRTNVDEIMIVSRGQKPSVPYLDRQHLLEFVSRISSVNGRNDLPVTLVQTDSHGTPQKAWMTASTQWLPYGFTPADLGLDKELKASIEKL